MKKIFLIIGLLLVSYLGISQSKVTRATAGNTVVDYRWAAALNMFVPVYPDTATATLPTNIGIDSCYAVIATRDVDAFWYRACTPYKHWVRVGTGANIPVLPDGVYSGGNVAWSGTGLTFNVSAASYVLGGVAYTFAGGQITLPPADPTFDRIDYIILDSTGANYVVGVPSANPQAPSLNPGTQLGRAFVTIPANSPTPAIITNIVFDQNAGQPTEWDGTSNGTVVFGNTNFPFHLNIAAAVSSLTDGQTITFDNSTTYNSSEQGSLVIFVRLGSAFDFTQNINVNLLMNGVIVGSTLNFTTYGLIKGTISSYVAVIIPMPDFSAANVQFNGIQFTAVGDLPAFNLDYIQFQTGFTQKYQQQNAFTTITTDNGVITATQPNSNVSFYGSGNIQVGKVNTDSVYIDGTLLIRNDVYFNSPQTSSGIWLDNHFILTNTAIQNNILDVQGNRGSVSLAQFIDTRVAGNGPTGGYFIHPITRFLASNMTTAHAASIYVGKSYSTNGTLILQYMMKNAAQGNTDVAAGIAFFGHTDVPFWFYPDSSLVIGVHDTKNDRYKLDMPLGMARINGGEIAAYASKGGTVNDSTIIWKAYLDSVLLTKGSGTVTNIAFNTATGIRSTSEPLTSTGTLRIDTTVIATRLYAANLITTYFNANVGSGFRIAIPNTNNIKTLLSGYALTWDSATSNSNKISIDTTLIATRAYVGAAGGAGTVSAFSFANANGILGVVTNNTTTPQLTLSTSVNGVVKANGTAFSSATAGTDYSVGTSALATGILKSTTTTGALSIAVAGDFPTLNQNTTGTAATITGIATVPHGGTGLSTLTAFGLLAAGTTSTGNIQQIGLGTAGQVLTSNGPGALATFQAVSVTSGVSSIIGTANQVIASAATGAVTLSLPQSIATTSNVTFQRGTFTGAAATANLILSSHTDPAAAAGVLTNNGTRLAFSLAATYKRFIFSNDVTPTAGQGLFGNGTDFTVGSYTAADNGMVVTASATGVTFKTNSTPQTLTTGATITWNVANGENANLTLANTGATLNIQNPVAGHTYVIAITQGTGGSRTITTWPAGTIWPAGTAPTLGTAVGAKNLISFFWNGTNYYGAFINSVYQ